jgi:hypothetical protein
MDDPRTLTVPLFAALLSAAACGGTADQVLPDPTDGSASVATGDGALDSSEDGAPPTRDAEPDAGGATSCAAGFPAVTDFSQPGPFATTTDDSTTQPSLGMAKCTVYRPKTLGMGGVKHPVVVWGNGTDAPGPFVYSWLLTHWASHGFIVAAANTGQAGTGQEMLACLEWVQTANATAGSPYEGHVATGFAASSGHSQGGGGAIMVGRDPRFVATVPFMPYTQGLGYVSSSATQQHGPMLLMSGGADTIAPPAQNQMPVFQTTDVPTFWGTLAGADHVSFALGGEKGYLAPSTAWLRLLLMCDDSGRPMFYGASCTLCTSSQWTVQRKDIE